MKKRTLIDAEINNFYNGTSEGDRLKYGLGPLEFERNQELIQRFLPENRGIIIDIGGGPGIYSKWLADFGHEVYLIDPVQKHIDLATKKAAKLKNRFTCILGESRKLGLKDNYADLVIMHGPLYHLQSGPDRLQSLKEAFRVLKTGGILLAFAINYTASTFVGLIQGAFYNESVYNMCMQELDTGCHNPPDDMPGVLPKAFYHRPEQLLGEIKEADFKILDLIAIEGMVWLDKHYFETRSNPGKKKQMMELLHKTEKDKNLLAVSPHILAVGRKK